MKQPTAGGDGVVQKPNHKKYWYNTLHPTTVGRNLSHKPTSHIPQKHPQIAYSSLGRRPSSKTLSERHEFCCMLASAFTWEKIFPTNRLTKTTRLSLLLPPVPPSPTPPTTAAVRALQNPYALSPGFEEMRGIVDWQRHTLVMSISLFPDKPSKSGGSKQTTSYRRGFCSSVFVAEHGGQELHVPHHGVLILGKSLRKALENLQCRRTLVLTLCCWCCCNLDAKLSSCFSPISTRGLYTPWPSANPSRMAKTERATSHYTPNQFTGTASPTSYSENCTPLYVYLYAPASLAPILFSLSSSLSLSPCISVSVSVSFLVLLTSLCSTSPGIRALRSTSSVKQTAP